MLRKPKQFHGRVRPRATTSHGCAHAPRNEVRDGAVVPRVEPAPTGPLDDPVRAALLGPHAHLAQRRGRAIRYEPDVSPFLAEPHGAAEWDDVAALVGDGRSVIPAFAPLDPPGPLEIGMFLPGVQMVGDAVVGRPDPEAVRLGPDDVPAMLARVARSRPGQFGRRSVGVGTSLGCVEGGVLIAMAGERLHPPGYTEISAVC